MLPMRNRTKFHFYQTKVYHCRQIHTEQYLKKCDLSDPAAAEDIKIVVKHVLQVHEGFISTMTIGAKNMPVHKLAASVSAIPRMFFSLIILSFPIELTRFHSKCLL